MRHIKLSATKRKKANTMHIGKGGIRDLMVSEVFEVLDDEVKEDLISEILILATLWVVFLAGDSADDLEEKAAKEEKTSKSLSTSVLKNHIQE
jgi:hypothetical protein